MMSLPLLALVAMTWMVWEASRAVYTHRQVAESTLRDYATLAAERLAYELNAEFQSLFYDQIGLLDALDDLGEPLAEEGGLPRAGGIPEQALLFHFQMDPESGRFRFWGNEPGPELRAWMGEAVVVNAATYPRPAPYAALTATVGGVPRTVVYRRVYGVQGDTDRIFGFAFAWPAMGPALERVTREATLLPSVLTGELADPQLFSIQLYAPGGTHVYESGPAPSQDAVFGATVYAAKAGRLKVSVGLGRSLAADLVIGGLPRSRLPLMVGLFVLVASLLLVSLAQLRRESELAKLREEFVASVSHELRTPLAQIRMFSETLLLGRFRDRREVTRSLRVIDQEARRLGNLVDSILTFTRNDGARRALEGC